MCGSYHTSYQSLQVKALCSMADKIEQKLNMSLDELAKKERNDERHIQKHRKGGPNKHPGRNGAERKAGQQRPSKQQQPIPCHPQHMPYGIQQFPNWGPVQQGWMQGGMMPMQQQAWQAIHETQGAYPRPSVFARLSAPQQLPQHPTQRPGPPKHRQQHHPAQQRPASPPKPDLQCRLDKQTGLVIIQHDGTDIVKVGPAGDVTLDSGADRSEERLAAMNSALSHINMSVKQVGDNWSVSDGKGLVRFADGLKLPAKGPLTAGRAMVLLQALTAGRSKAAATAAQQASTEAAIAAGLMPRTASSSGAVVAEGADTAAIRRLKAQGRYAPY